jgi:hypothetical protein
MDPSEFLAEYYESLIQRCDSSGRPNGLPHHDRVIYYIISVRCEMDINGFESVFDQLLTEEELLFLIDALREVDAIKLAEMFALAHSRLKSAGFFKDGSMMVCESGDADSDRGLLDEIEDKLREHEELWELDERLVALIPEGSA